MVVNFLNKQNLTQTSTHVLYIKELRKQIKSKFLFPILIVKFN